MQFVQIRGLRESHRRKLNTPHPGNFNKGIVFLFAGSAHFQPFRNDV